MSPLKAPHIMPSSHVVDVARLDGVNLNTNLVSTNERYLADNLRDSAVRFVRSRVLQASSQHVLPNADGRVGHPIFPQDRDIKPPKIRVLEGMAFPATENGLGMI